MRPLFVLAVASLMTASASVSGADNWEKPPGSAQAISAGADGSIWIIGNKPATGGFSLHRWNGKEWDEFKGVGAVRLAIGAKGEPWIVTSKNDVYRYENEKWEKLPGKAQDIAVGADGSVWATGLKRLTGGFSVQKWNGKDWDEIPGAAAVRVAVDPKGVPWVVNAKNEIFRLAKPEWEKVPGAGQAIGIGGDGSVWVIGTNRATGGFGLFRWDGKRWEEVEGGGVAVAVDDKGKPWVVNAQSEIYRRK